MIDHRTYGSTHTCKGCRFWSEMIARSEGSSVVAMCLAPAGALSGQHTHQLSTCQAWASGYDGAIDEPGTDPLRYAELDREGAR